jgi:hypothetical protein
MSQQNGGPEAPPAGRGVVQPTVSMNAASSQHSLETSHSRWTTQYSSTHVQSNSNSAPTAQHKAPKAPLIPKLSPTTTELLARINGQTPDVKIERSFPSLWAGRNVGPWFPAVLGLLDFPNSNPNLDNMGRMKQSSAIVELPEGPFPKTPVAPSQSPATVSGLVNIAPKPAAQRAQGQPAAIPPQPLAAPASFGPASLQTPSEAATKPPQKAAIPRQKKSVTDNAKRGKKRRRNEDSDDDNVRAGDSSSDESDFTPVATQTKSGRQVQRPSLFVPPPAPTTTIKLKVNPPVAPKGATTAALTLPKKKKKTYRKGQELNVICAHCQRGASPPTNKIVFCDGCNRAWHQFCHEPPIENKVIEVKEAEWFCRGCKPPIETSSVDEGSSAQIRSGHQAPRMTAAESQEARVSGNMFSAEERRGYLSGLSHAALVDLLVDLSDRNPTLPIFPRNLKDLKQSKFVGAMPTVISAPRPEPEPLPAVAPPSQPHRDDSSSDSGSEYEIEEHRLYPRAGNGFRLPPETEDLDILLEDPACPTFSYALHAVVA